MSCSRGVDVRVERMCTRFARVEMTWYAMPTLVSPTGDTGTDRWRGIFRNDILGRGKPIDVITWYISVCISMVEARSPVLWHHASTRDVTPPEALSRNEKSHCRVTLPPRRHQPTINAISFGFSRSATSEKSCKKAFGTNLFGHQHTSTRRQPGINKRKQGVCLTVCIVLFFRVL